MDVCLHCHTFVSFSSVLCACICFVVILFLFDSNCVKMRSNTTITRISFDIYDSAHFFLL